MRFKYYLSLIIPAYNEEKKIKNDIEKAYQFLKKAKINAEIIVSTDGTTDKTNIIVENLKEKYPSLKLITVKKKIGKGAAIKKGVKIARGKYIMFADAGYCVPFDYIKDGLAILKQGGDCALASRGSHLSKIRRKQPLYREIGSQIFGILVRNFIGVPKHINDTQCGFKLYKSDVAKKLYQQLKTKSFMFDIEIILRAKRSRYIISQFPVAWSNDQDTKFNPLLGSIINFRDLLLFKTRYKL